jgi:hypothetical protein
VPEVAVVIGPVNRIVFTVCITVVAKNIAADAKYLYSVGIQEALGLRIVISAFLLN